MRTIKYYITESVTTTYEVNIDEKDYREYLNGEEPDKSNLEDYVLDLIFSNSYINSQEDSDVVDSGFID